MNNKSRVIIGVVFVVLFLVAVVAFEATQTNVTTSQPNNITKQNDTQVQIQNKTNIEKTKPEIRNHNTFESF